MGRKSKKAKIEAKVDAQAEEKKQAERMTKHDILAQSLELLAEGIKTGSTVSLRKCQSLLQELMLGNVKKTNR